ncbi:hypothetical protein GE118_01400 [Mycoplasma sp. NEAQ87857]|uniref:hypothetical protein n=1 Tax=Mycoplasma sp. NEAQ87857 TaxID=2683967 RepID=UPI0013195308|nr:hypothetical protein [Mycoplasma sp. NEAQ87857]QGZ97450.1 hypothetical protein GE118_01400 [Mycoplasma sp. NEAQ87857]
MKIKLTQNKDLKRFFNKKSLNSFLTSFILELLAIAFWTIAFKVDFESYGMQLLIGFTGVILITLSILTRYIDSVFYSDNILLNRLLLANNSYWNKFGLNILWISPILFFIFKQFYLFKNITLNIKDNNELSDIDLDKYLKVFQNDAFDRFINKNLRLNTSEIAISGILMGIFVIVTYITRLTLAKFIGLNFEYVFYIIFAYLFRYFKGTFLAIASDILILLITGRLGTWYWAYALVPIMVVIYSSVFFDVFEKNKTVSVIYSNLALIAAFISLTVVFIFQAQAAAGLNGKIKISQVFGLRSISLWVGILLMILAAISLIITWILTFLFFKKQKEQLLYYVISFALATSVVVFVRWIWGPYAFIKYYMYLGRFPSNFDVKSKYIAVMIPIIIKSLVAVPLYTYLLTSLIHPLKLLKHKFLIVKSSYGY